MSGFIANWLHIPRTSAVQVIMLIKVSERSTKEGLCKNTVFLLECAPFCCNAQLFVTTGAYNTTSNHQDCIILEFYGTQQFLADFTTAGHLIISSARWIQSMPSYPVKDATNTIFPSVPRSSKWFLLFRFLHQNPTCIILFPHACHMTDPSHLPWFELPNNIQTGKHSFWQPIPGYLSIWGPNYSCEIQVW